MLKPLDAEIVRALAVLAGHYTGDKAVMRKGLQIASRMGPRPRIDQPMHTNRADARRLRKTAAIRPGSLMGA
jgi:hypothetical protein